MRRRNKELNIFSMSALDLFASALGAFILIAVVLFPFFPNIGSSPENVAALRAELNETKQQLEVCQSGLAQTRAELQQSQQSLQQVQAELQQSRQSLQQCAGELRKKFLLIVISWGSRDDVDLHVIDPQGNEFYYDKRTHRGSEAKLEEDNTVGPGNEIWLHPKATPGEYQIYYKLYRKASGSVSVRGGLLTPGGRESIPDQILRRESEKPRVAVVTVDNAGNVTLQTR